ncbi:LicD family protein [Nitzschia inconspicua]|uniref:LicD family protein n=1 Tax=Nitzschia inconspicua TaxID=303405 RepID=A0A9K3L352_9STRA|nr:LicD family protein [Nitzschia inconspicua]
MSNSFSNDEEQQQQHGIHQALVEQWIPMDRTLFRTYQLLHLAALQKVDEIFTAAKLDYWISGGTLLGALRHQGFVPHDDDLDIECFAEDLERISAIPTDDEYCGMTRGGQWQGFPVYKLHFRGDVCVDVFPRRNLQIDLSTDDAEKKFFPTFDETFPLRRYTFENVSVLGPNEGYVFMRRLYGEDCFDNVLVWNHDFNYFHSKGFDARKAVVSLEKYNHIIRTAGIESPAAEVTALKTYETAFSNFEGGEDEFLRQLHTYKRQRTFRWNQADAEWRYEQQTIEEERRHLVT